MFSIFFMFSITPILMFITLCDSAVCSIDSPIKFYMASNFSISNSLIFSKFFLFINYIIPIGNVLSNL